MGYSAGAIFLQVVPVFKDVQNDTKQYAEGINRSLGAEMDKAGRQIGENTGKRIAEGIEKQTEEGAKRSMGRFQAEYEKTVRDMQRAVGPIDVKFENNDARRNISEIRKELDDLSKTKIKTNLDAREATEKLAILQAQMESLSDDLTIKAKADFNDAMAAGRKWQKFRDGLERDIEIDVRFNHTPAERALGAFEKQARSSFEKAAQALGDSMDPEIKRLRAELDGLANSEFDIDVSTEEARAKITALSIELRDLSKRSPNIDVKVNAGRAAAELVAVRELVGLIDGRDVDIEVNSDGIDDLINRLAGGSRGLDLFKAKGDAASSTFRSLNPLVAALAILLPTIGPAGAAAAGGIAALGPAAFAAMSGIGVLILGLGGIVTAVKALSAQQSASAKVSNTASKAMASAANQVQSAEQSLADAERNAGRAQADAARQVAEAKRQSARAIKDALSQQRQAQQDYADSVKSVQQAEQDLADARKKAQQDQRDLQDQIANNGIAIRQALIDEFNAQVALNNAKADGSSTPLEIDQAQINYDQAAQSIKELREQQQDLQAQQQKAQSGGIDGANNVKSAQDALSTALEKQQNDYENLGKAAAKVDQSRADGARRVATALRQQKRSQEDNAEAIKKAQQALSQAKAGLAQAAIDTGEMAAAQQKVENAMANLGPAGQAFAKYIFGLKSGFTALRSDVEEQILPPMQAAMENFFTVYGPRAHRFIVNIAKGIGQLTNEFSKSLTGPAWNRFFGSMEKFGPSINRAFGRATISLLQGFASIMTVLAPYTEKFATAVQHVADSFASWAASKSGQDQISRFMAYAAQEGPSVVGLFVALSKAFLAVVEAAAPLGNKILSALTDFFDFIANIPSDTLTSIVQGIISLTLAVQGAAVAGTIILSVSAAFASVLQASIALLILAAYHSNSFREGLKGVAKWVYENRDALIELAQVVGGIILAYKAIKLAVAAYNTVLEVARGLQLGYAIVTERSLKATKVNTAAVKIGQAATKAWMAITAAFTAEQEASNAALLTNPYVAIAVAVIALVTVLVILFKKNKTVHDAIMKAWGLLKDAGKAVWGALETAFKAVAGALEQAWKAMEPILSVLWDVFSTVGKIIFTIWEDEIKIALVLMLALFKLTWLGIQALWNDVLQPVFNAIGWVFGQMWAGVKFLVHEMGDVIDAEWHGIKVIWKTVLKPVFDAIGAVVTWLWKTIFKPAFDAIGQIVAPVFSGIKKVWDKTLKPVFDTIGNVALPALQGAFKTAVGAIGDLWSGLKKIFTAPIKFVVDTVLNDGLFAAVNKLADWVGVSGLKIKPIKLPDAIEKAYATGGVLPGYTPGRDVHTFVSPTAGRLHLSGGEAIMRPEFTRAVGTGFVDQMNATARRGGVNAVRRMLGVQAYARGGVFGSPDTPVSMNGMSISRIAAAQVALARQLFGIPIYMMQGGFGGNHIAASGTSHNYPGVGDFGPGSIQLEAALRKVGFAAWARNIPGRSQVGSGAHVHAVSLLDPGDARSPQVYGSWASDGNGLAGANNDPAPHYPWVAGLRDKIAAMGISQIANLVTGSAAAIPHIANPGKLNKVLDIVKAPFEWVRGLVTKPLEAVKDKVSGSKIWQAVTDVPKHMVKAVTNRVWDLVPGPLKAAAGWAGDGAKWVVGGAKAAAGAVGGAAKELGHGAASLGSDVAHVFGFADGGILPYNGTMKYDAGGYLPPGLTSVVNLTGKPEPVFTSDQYAEMERIGGTTYRYEPHFEGSDLTPGDVAQDMDFAFRKMERRGKYGKVG